MQPDVLSEGFVPAWSDSRVHWKRQQHQFVAHVCAQLRQRPQVTGIAIGGSLARGMEWRHSDVELGIVVTEHLADLGHFNVQDQRGIEVFQLDQTEWLAKVAEARENPLLVAHWPLQLFQCRIVYDAGHVFQPFKEIFDASLFLPPIVTAHRDGELAQFDERFARGLGEMRAGYPATALVGLRDAFNSLILAFYWQHGILPRSQNRTDVLLHRHCRHLGELDFYHLYRQVYALGISASCARDLLEACRADVESAVDVWGPGTREFFRHAVDGTFAWGIADSVLTVYRLCVPLCLCAGEGQERLTDDPAWRTQHETLCAFLGLADLQAEQVSDLFEHVAAARAALVQ